MLLLPGEKWEKAGVKRGRKASKGGLYYNGVSTLLCFLRHLSLLLLSLLPPLLFPLLFTSRLSCYLVALQVLIYTWWSYLVSANQHCMLSVVVFLPYFHRYLVFCGSTLAQYAVEKLKRSPGMVLHFYFGHRISALLILNQIFILQWLLMDIYIYLI